MSRPNEYILKECKRRGTKARTDTRYRLLRIGPNGVTSPIATITIPVLPTMLAGEIGSALNHALSEYLKQQRGN